ncbi:uncharacterized protein LOC135839812 [Planococcus citri]|uniref:uncharacterized protein LOC135839812 n=1 Tax=Planococcus citri TaxID=170843 RepID=UPI0031F89857
MLTNNAFLFLFSIIITLYCLITSSKATEVFAWEDYQLMKGEEFCKTRKDDGFFLENMCHQIADENYLKDYQPKSMAASCDQKCTISIIHVGLYEFKKITEDLLVCRYNRIEGGEDTTTPFAVRALGTGKEKNDVMEYYYNDGIAKPHVNRPWFLYKIDVLILEQYNELLEGDDFCSTKDNADFMKYLCVKIAEKTSFKHLVVIKMDASCHKTKISMYSRDQRKTVVIEGKLLRCHYGKDIDSVPLVSRALGRGKAKSDVMEYSFKDDLAVPRVNRPNLLNEIHVLTLEEHESLKGADFCTTRKLQSHGFINICISIAYANSISNYKEELLNMTCSKTSISIFSEKENKFVEIEENLLHCEYKRFNTEGGIDWFASKVLGRGRGKDDVMDYDYSYLEAKPIATPFSNRRDFLLI